MGISPNTDDEGRQLRPLPSVAMPLLPQDRRAARIRAILAAGFILIAGGGGAVIALFWHDLPRLLDSAKMLVRLAASARNAPAPCVNLAPPAPSGAGAKPKPPAAPPAQGGAPEPPGAALEATTEMAATADSLPVEESTKAPEVESARGQIKRNFGNASSFREALLSAGASRQEAAALIAALGKVVDFRRCKPEHELVFERDPAGRLTRFEYRVDPVEIYRAERDRRGALRGRKLHVPVEIRRIAKGGYISTSLGESLDGVGLGKSFAGLFVEILQGQIDFRKDARSGDSFKAIVDGEYLSGNFFRFGTLQALEYLGQRKGKLRAFWYVPKNEKGDYYESKGRTIQGGWLRTPLRYDYISSRFDRRRMHPVLRRVVPHLGIDYAASPGTLVRAAAKGVISFAGERGANGNLVVISHEGGYETFYAHLLHVARSIRPGVQVEQRQIIGSVGSTGLSTGPHLHFGLRRNNKFVDPGPLLNGPGKPLSAAELTKFLRIQRKLSVELDNIRLSRAPENSGAPLAPPKPELPIEGTEAL